MKTKRNQAFTLLELLVVVTIIAILAGLAVPTYTYVQMLANQTRGVSNARQIIVSMKLFSKEHSSQYPDSVPNPQNGTLAQNANDAFRFLIQEKIVPDERIFGCPAGYNPDGSIGMSPGYATALMPGENHWAMTAGLTDTAVGTMPLVYENPAVPSWPPLWNADLAGRIGPGRTWSGGRIIIGRNDGSAAVETLADVKGMVGPKMMAGGVNLFTQASEGVPQRVLPIVPASIGTGIPDPQANEHPTFPPLASGPPPAGGVQLAPQGLPGSLLPSSLGQ